MTGGLDVDGDGVGEGVGGGEDDIESGGGSGGGAGTCGRQANSINISAASSPNSTAKASTAAASRRSGPRGTTGAGTGACDTAGPPPPAQYGTNPGPRRHRRTAPLNATGSKNRSAPAGRAPPAVSGSYRTATHGSGPSGCAATTGAPSPLSLPGSAAKIAARNRSRAAGSLAAPRRSTATVACRPRSSSPKNTIPADVSSSRADNRNGPNRTGSPDGNGLDIPPH